MNNSEKLMWEDIRDYKDNSDDKDEYLEDGYDCGYEEKRLRETIVLTVIRK